jgi:hypothetical protein
MTEDTYKPDGKCGTCRHSRHVRDGDGWHEPLSYSMECAAEDQLIQIGKIRQEVADDCGDEDAYGPDGIDGCGDTKPCPLYLELAVCERHGLREGGEFGCPKCDEEAYDAMAKQEAEDEKLAAQWRAEKGL